MADCDSGSFSLTIVGSGVSTGVPVIGHLFGGCACAVALRDAEGPNRRNNVSLLITVPSPPDDGSAGQCVKHILIDCGKTFRDAYFRVLAKHHVQAVDALLLTHDHADAMGGLDDMRDLQRMRTEGHDDWFIEQYVSTYASEKTLNVLRKQFGYILRNSREIGPAPLTAEEHESLMQRVAEERRRVGLTNKIGMYRSAALDLFTLPDKAPTPFYLPALGADFPIYSVPVEHGAGYIALGFVFGRGAALRSAGATDASVANGSCVVYLSDVSAVPVPAMTFLHDLVKIDVLIVDLLYGPGKRHPTHYCMDDVMRLVASLQPTRTYTIGMYCDVEHERGNGQLRERLEELRRSGKCGDGVRSVELGFDGLHIRLPL
ncbi:uncharacterized protein Tco025E_02615 [Trypanosoma conorhini]|uniref:Metallo-beta-lactamase domain-containing protein n=1 Tax=Trypanosoma conorhini TaxID=83891 RepID=A0A3R7N208_9TRYP|nr:uncharacterized protein Tco025E_02615 [Trypanosoma conorhini]RNF24115.1 hypothetical protein Tco025E_02615 [Trypanosoma conorhini]